LRPRNPGRLTGASGDVAAHPGHILPTLILYPARAPGGPGATPVSAAGPFPLVVFSHGWGMHGLLYGNLLRPWAAAGFVVSAPTFPLTSIGAPGGGVIGEYVNQPADVSFVVTQMLRRDRGDGLGGLVNRHRIAAVGHSLGAVTTLALASNRCCRDTRIRAAVAIAGEDLRSPVARSSAPRAHPSC
jgi:predicted dienelactone hydrolase